MTKQANKVSVERVAARFMDASYSGNPGGVPIYPNEIDHGVTTEPLAGGTDIMRRLQNNLLIEQGNTDLVRPESPKAASHGFPTGFGKKTLFVTTMPTKLGGLGLYNATDDPAGGTAAFWTSFRSAWYRGGNYDIYKLVKVPDDEVATLLAFHADDSRQARRFWAKYQIYASPRKPILHVEKEYIPSYPHFAADNLNPEFVFIVEDTTAKGKFFVAHSMHRDPRMGMQVLKEGLDKTMAEDFAKDKARRWGATVIRATKQGPWRIEVQQGHEKLVMARSVARRYLAR